MENTLQTTYLYIFFDWKCVYFFTKIPLNFVPKASLDSKCSIGLGNGLVPKRPNLSPQTIMTHFHNLVPWHINALGINELTSGKIIHMYIYWTATEPEQSQFH